ncbi:hypothetical protein E2C01_099930 [Portunus trituberculatus]|uniref:Uncharacterized protein n=1 Tax=Portunus trituberculatus TaxID=210409 RepID=A0A5B7K1M8_PORTR|nr:hypothetical protein [Portunus trituberculatus]
MMKLHEKL